MQRFSSYALYRGIFCIALSSAYAQTPKPTPEPKMTVLHCPALIDSVNGKMLDKTSVVISDTKIKEVVPGFVTRPGAQIVELPNHTCIPGLIDMHTHINIPTAPGRTRYTEPFYTSRVERALRATRGLKNTLYMGFTSIRVLGDEDYTSVDMKNDIGYGFLVGPRIFTAGPAIGSTGGHADPTDGLQESFIDYNNVSVVDSPEAARKAVRMHYKRGADLIKIMTSGGVFDLGTNGDNPQMTTEEIKAVVETAHDYGFRVAVHAHGAEGVHRAVVAGVDSIEHGTFASDEDLQLMKEKGIYLVPTLITAQTAYENGLKHGFYPPAVEAKALKVGPHTFANAAKAYKIGVKIVYGTDSEIHNGDFELMVKAGMPAMYTIQAATNVASILLQRETELGSVDAGKIADVVAVPGNPLKDISLMKKVDFVMKDGVVYKQNDVPTLQPE
jgi:imidazolonepropionase-like amidohydrolase